MYMQNTYVQQDKILPPTPPGWLSAPGSLSVSRSLPFMDPLLTISALRTAAAAGKVRGCTQVQVESTTRKETRDGRPFFEVHVVDASDKFTLRAWHDSVAFPLCGGLQPGTFLEICGEFSLGNYGLDAKEWQCRELTEAERQALLAGNAEQGAKVAADFAYLTEVVATLRDPRLRTLGEVYLTEYGERLSRTAAARGNHHARRGGLVEHTAQMLRCALALQPLYPGLNRCLLIAGVLFHDCGKLWENQYQADGFAMPFSEYGELLGHIPIGLELVNFLWRRLLGQSEAAAWATLQPASEQVRLHLLHLVASHHGCLEFGSPVVPKTPEAWLLHYVDNLDAKMEMMAHSYAQPKAPNSRIFERVWPLPGSSVRPLESFPEPPPVPPAVELPPLPPLPVA